MGCVLRLRFERLGNHGINPSVVNGARCARPRCIEQSIKPQLQKTATPFADSLFRYFQLSRDGLVLSSIRTSQHDS